MSLAALVSLPFSNGFKISDITSLPNSNPTKLLMNFTHPADIFDWFHQFVKKNKIRYTAFRSMSEPFQNFKKDKLPRSNFKHVFFKTTLNSCCLVLTDIIFLSHDSCNSFQDCGHWKLITHFMASVEGIYILMTVTTIIHMK